jgi:hypothetical protein
VTAPPCPPGLCAASSAPSRGPQLQAPQPPRPGPGRCCARRTPVSLWSPPSTGRT